MNTMKQFIGFVFIIMLFSCKKDDPEKEGPCGVKNPVEELSWLKQDIELFTSKPPYLDFAYYTKKYKGERVFWLYSVSTFGNLTYRTCDGARKYIPTPLPEDKETKDFITLLLSSKASCPYLIWSTPNFQKYTPCP